MMFLCSWRFIFINSTMEKMMFVQRLHTGYQSISDSLYYQALEREDFESFSAYDENNRLGIAWRENDSDEGTYLFMTNHFIEDEYDEQYGEMIVITEQKLSDDIRRIDDEIRKAARQVSTISVSERAAA